MRSATERKEDIDLQIANRHLLQHTQLGPTCREIHCRYHIDVKVYDVIGIRSVTGRYRTM